MTKIIDVVDVIGEGSDRAGSPEVAQHPHHHFSYRANGVDEPPVLHSQFRRYGIASAAVVADHGAGLVEPAKQRPVQDVVDAAGGGEQGAGEQAADLGQ